MEEITKTNFKSAITQLGFNQQCLFVFLQNLFFCSFFVWLFLSISFCLQIKAQKKPWIFIGWYMLFKKDTFKDFGVEVQNTEQTHVKVNQNMTKSLD